MEMGDLKGDVSSSSQEDMVSKKASSSSMDVDGNNPKLSVLVVDDDATLRKIHSMFLKKHGFETTAVVNGQEAVNLYRSGSRFHMVLMDRDMPVMNGPMATRELRSMGVSSMIVGLTSRDLDSELQEFMQSGLDDCFVEPLTAKVADSLAKTVAKKFSK